MLRRMRHMPQHSRALSLRARAGRLPPDHPRMSIVLRLIAVFCLAILPALPARAESAKITFILTNDIYSMGDTLMPIE